MSTSRYALSTIILHLPIFVVLAPSSVSRCMCSFRSILKPEPASKRHIPTPSLWVCHPAPPTASHFLAAPKLWSLKRDTLLAKTYYCKHNKIDLLLVPEGY